MANQKPREHKQFDAMITGIDDQGLVKAIFNVFGNVDETKDRVWPGAFSKTFVERGNKVLVLDNHNANSTGDVVAKVAGLKELSRGQLPPEVLDKYPDATGGAEIIAQFEPDPAKDAKSAAAFYRLKNGWVKSWSFGYDALDYDFATEQVEGHDMTIRNLRGMRLYEVSPVLWPANPATMTTGAKSKPAEGKPYGSFRRGDKWEVFKLDEDGNPMGRSLGEHDSEEEADSQVRALYTNEGKAVTGNKGDENYIMEKLSIWNGTAWAALYNNEINELKAGRVLAKRNLDRIKTAYNALREALDDAGILSMMEDEEDEEESTGPLKSKTAPTPEGAGPHDEAPDYIKLIEIEQLQAALMEV